MTLLLLLLVLAVVGAGWEYGLVPWWERRHERRAELRRACAQAGHQWGEIFPACGDPNMPTRNCERCGEQEHMKRCPMCRKALSGGRPVEPQESPTCGA